MKNMRRISVLIHCEQRLKEKTIAVIVTSFFFLYYPLEIHPIKKRIGSLVKSYFIPGIFFFIISSYNACRVDF